MPYYLLPIDVAKSDDRPAIDAAIEAWTNAWYDGAYPDVPSCSFATRQQAQEACPAGRMPFYRPTYEETQTWKYRERNKFRTGRYTFVPWAELDRYPDHYVHVSRTMPGMVAYTPTEEHGHQDRQVRCRPGKYLQEFYSDVDKATRDRWSADCASGTEELKIATTADEIERVYRGRNYDPDRVPFCSCMGPDCHADFDEHPTRVYGDSDLAVAYLGDIDSARARVVVWPSKKRFGRIYGTDRLRAVLESAGWANGSMSGARIRAIEHNGGYLMPYLDNISGAETVLGGYIRLGDGPIETDSTRGWVDCDEPEERCQNCDDTYRVPDRDDDPGFCPHCDSIRWYCEACDSDCFGERVWCHDRDQDICSDCANDYRYTCLVCDSAENETSYSRDRQASRADDRTERHICPDCAEEEHWRVCGLGDCREPLPEEHSGPCPACDGTPLCPHTVDLLAILDQPEVPDPTPDPGPADRDRMSRESPFAYPPGYRHRAPEVPATVPVAADTAVQAWDIASSAFDFARAERAVFMTQIMGRFERNDNDRGDA